MTCILWSCGAPPSPPAQGAEKRAWPPPPEPPRIVWLQEIRGPRDLGVPDSWWKRLKGMLLGEEETGFVRPTHAVRSGDRLAVADAGSQAVYLFRLDTGYYRKVARVAGQPLLSPVSLAFGAEGDLYVADSALARVFCIGPDGEHRRTLSGFRRPTGLAFHPERRWLYVMDTLQHRIHLFENGRIRKAVFGERGSEAGQFNFATYLSLDREGRLYVTDTMNFRVQILDPLGRPLRTLGRPGDGSGDMARPKGVAVDPDGHVYVVDALFDAVQIFDTAGRFLLAFGERGVGPGQFWLPTGLSIDPEGRIYVADSYNQRIQVFRYLGRRP